MATEKEALKPKEIKVESSIPGYAHTRISGSCGQDVTVEDIEKKFYHSYFGGRNAWVRDGKFGVITHTD